MADSQIETQPSNGIDSQSQQVPVAGAWAKLVITDVKESRCVWLINNIFKFGRLDQCDLTPKNMKLKLEGAGVSKFHFIIEKRTFRGVSVAYLRDMSTYGTFINGDLVGNGVRRVLGHKDFISVVKSEYKILQFSYLSVNEQILLPLPKQVEINYHVVDFITNGRFNQVYYVLNKKTCQPFAMKFANVSLNVHQDDGYSAEMKIFEVAKHSNLIKYHDKVMVHNNLYVFVEYMGGGDLGQLLHRKGTLPEFCTRHIARQIISGLAFLHSLKIAHRNIRPKNILLSENTDNPTVKITNYRNCKLLKKDTASVKTLGTTVYDAPETKFGGQGTYDVRVDVYSLGVLLYVCLCGREPPDGLENSTGDKIYLPKEIWSQISPLAKSIIEVTTADLKTRFYAKQLLTEPWFITDLSLNRKRPNILGIANRTPKRQKV